MILDIFVPIFVNFQDARKARIICKSAKHRKWISNPRPGTATIIAPKTTQTPLKPERNFSKVPCMGNGYLKHLFLDALHNAKAHHHRKRQKTAGKTTRFGLAQLLTVFNQFLVFCSMSGATATSLEYPQGYFRQACVIVRFRLIVIVIVKVKCQADSYR